LKKDRNVDQDDSDRRYCERQPFGTQRKGTGLDSKISKVSGAADAFIEI
jgi:hypothetical protein